MRDRKWTLRQLKVAEQLGRHPFLKNGCEPYDYQRPPPGLSIGLVYIWLLLAGRGAGKTAACANYVDRYMIEHPGHRAGIIAPTLGDAVESCYRGETGLMAFNPSLRLTQTGGAWRVLWPNGSVARLFGARFPDDVERLRAGGNRHIDWWEELAAWRKLNTAMELAEMGLRLGDWPHVVASTTPKPKRRIGELIERDGLDVALTRATMYDNPNLPAAQVARLEERHKGTRLERQELKGEYIGEAEGALWTRELIELTRVRPEDVPPPERIVVALDPAEGDVDGDEQGIAVAAKGLDGDYYLLHTEGSRKPRVEWIRRACFLVRWYGADRLVYEANKGGKWIGDVIRQVWEDAPAKPVYASRGKLTRAEPISALWERGRGHIVGGQADLEDQLCDFDGTGDSPALLDSSVWAVTELSGGGPLPSKPAEEPGEQRELGYPIDKLRELRRKQAERRGSPFGDQPDVPPDDMRW